MYYTFVAVDYDGRVPAEASLRNFRQGRDTADVSRRNMTYLGANYQTFVEENQRKPKAKQKHSHPPADKMVYIPVPNVL